MEDQTKRTILLFVDGLGWGKDDPSINPQHVYDGQLFKLPPNVAGQTVPLAAGGYARPIDAILGVGGVPQSATGQTTLLSGQNSQLAIGQHLSGFPSLELRQILLEHSILRRFAEHGLQARFFNAFHPRFFELTRERQLTFSATTVANLAGELPFFSLDEMEDGKSIYQEFTNQELIDKGFEVGLRTPDEAGSILARESQNFDFTLFEYFRTDRAGHSMDMDQSCHQLGKLDIFLSRILHDLEDARAENTLVVLTSDHGNIEDLSTKRHTLNPVPLMAWGKGAEEFMESIEGLDEVAGAILARHGIR